MKKSHIWWWNAFAKPFHWRNEWVWQTLLFYFFTSTIFFFCQPVMGFFTSSVVTSLTFLPLHFCNRLDYVCMCVSFYCLDSKPSPISTLSFLLPLHPPTHPPSHKLFPTPPQPQQHSLKPFAFLDYSTCASFIVGVLHVFCCILLLLFFHTVSSLSGSLWKFFLHKKQLFIL